MTVTIGARRDSVYKSSLRTHVDAGDPESYPGSGNVWYDLSGHKDITRNAATWNSAGYFTVVTHTQLYVAAASAQNFEYEYDEPRTMIVIAEINDSSTGALMGKMPSVGYQGWDMFCSIGSGNSVACFNCHEWTVKGHRRYCYYPGSVTINKICMVAITYDGSGLISGVNGYIDGRKCTQFTDLAYDEPLNETMITTNQNFGIGDNGGWYALTGNYYVASIYAEELSARNIWGYYQYYKDRIPGLV